MARYRKKPVVIEAKLWPNDGVAEWCGGTLQADGSLVIATLEGTMRAEPGDYIIRGVQGEFYPCKPDIFVATYDPEDDDGN